MVDDLPYLYQRPSIHISLARAAKNRNARAFYYLSFCFSNYEYSKESDRIFIKAKALCKEQNDCILHSWMCSSDSEKEMILQEQTSQKMEGERLFYLSIVTKDTTKSLKLLQDSLLAGYEYAQIELARTKKKDEAFQMYLDAGNAGIASGFENAARMIVKESISSQQFTSTQLWEKAMMLGQMESAEDLLEHHLQCGEVKLAEKVAEQMQRLQYDMSGYVLIGNWFKKRANNQKAREFYMKAGPFYGYLCAATIAKNRKEKNKLIEEAMVCKKEHFAQILAYLKDILNEEESKKSV